MQELTSLEDLLHLQAVDLEIDRLLEERQSLPELDQFKAAHAASEAAGAKLAELTSAHRETSLQLDKTDGELTLSEEKKATEERRLYAGGLNARETEALMSEVEMLGRQVAEKEEATLKLMEVRDEQQAEVDAATAELDAAEASKQQLEARIAEKWDKIDADIARQELKKAEAVKPVPTELLELYEEIRPHKEGVAAARLGEGICGGCHLRLTEAEQLQASKSDPPRCIHCLRILVFQ
jgi:predicted  nucleic acid-binding Zn-ribbon protein